ncbi:hypothetical protein [Actinotalea fermentans]|uniref:Lipoprotein n=1 Tax=Actinotalea fermentans TaxID=43671 RepID=A0A511YWY9_9CELL|nr:hypothetical protein [Actinotalea fermentans]KGM15461.1 hypothetical protein N867_08275 [Actinotalea fermentans ATCC 43279 = JCM 9966 = DSM 3133]GEN79702.1 hypothetical protein AFE02nite_14360 [Actinotalea fermentans]
MRARRSVVAVGAAVVAAVVAGCAPQPGTVAEIDGRTISEADLDRVTDELGPFLNDASRGAVLTALVQSQAGLELGELNDVEVSEERAAEFLTSLAKNSGVDATEWSEGSLTIARMQLLGGELAQLPDAEATTAQFQQILADLDVTVSPRYGEYDPATGEIVALQPDWIVDPAAAEPAE